MKKPNKEKIEGEKIELEYKKCTSNYEYGWNNGYVYAWDLWQEYHNEVFKKLVKRIKDIQKKLPPRKKRKRNVIELLNNWKEHINAIDKLIQETENRIKEEKCQLK